jgi:beta-galactosidase
MHRLIFALSLAVLAPVHAGTFEAKGRDFVLDGKPLQILSGEMHYPRTPHELWRDRLQKARAMGLNTICTYVFWNFHEPKPGVWDFSGDKDLVGFIKVCQEEGLHVIVRPGPYVCTEWDCGGIPGWTLADPATQIRTTDPRFLKPAMAYLEKIAGLLKPLQVEHGGPVLMVQVENEYGSFGGDKEFLKAHVTALRKGGYTGALFTSDGPTDGMLKGGTLPDVTATINFGGGAKGAFEELERFRPGQPRMNGEFWVGWFDHWGKPHQTTAAGPKAADFDWMLSNGISVNIYMFHGGTNFGFTAGANWTGRYDCDTTSYDYSAVLDEAGRPTDKFDALREVIRKRVAGATCGEMPAPLPVITIPEIRLTKAAVWLDDLPRPVSKAEPVHMETLGQSFGYLLYQTSVTGPVQGPFAARLVRDRAHVLLDNRPVAVLDRRCNRFSANLDIPPGKHTLGVLVENLARINFSREMLNERKGMFGPVTLAGRALGPWDHVSLPLDDPAALAARATGDPAALGTSGKPVIYQGGFDLTKTGDTWLDLRGFGKGHVWINGHHLGRYWEIGPQQALYLPGCWLKQGGNTIVLLETDKPGVPLTLKGLDGPVWETKIETAQFVRKPGQQFRRDGLTPVLESEFAPGTAWQEIKLPAGCRGRYFALESLDAHDNQPFAAVAELIFRDQNGREIPREKMRVIYADSEELAGDNGTATNVIDNQPTTFWHSEWQQNKPPHPHQVVLDLGAVQSLAGFRYLPRPGMPNQGGRIKRFRVYLANEPFPGL